jgi:hypothetical protein
VRQACDHRRLRAAIIDGGNVFDESNAVASCLKCARELPNLPLEDALQLVQLYAERGSPKYEKAAMRWLERYLTEHSPRLSRFAEVTADLARREPDA